MTRIFINIINMSISASFAVLVILLLRIFLKKAPKWILVALWGIAAFRLISPFTFESVLSLIPSAETVSPNIMTTHTPTIDSGIPVINNALNPIISESFSPAPGNSAHPLQIVVPVLALIWAVGIAAMLVYMAISYAKLKKKVDTAVLLESNIYQSESVRSPFVLGLIKPKIYIPFHMHEKDIAYVTAHEQAHIRRKDHVWKPLGFLLLALHWFNPLMWLAYILLCRDIEMACDEKVVKGLAREERADYSEALLACSVNRRTISACPLAFGEVGVKNRVKSVLNYKKPAFWIIAAAIALSVAAAVGLLTNPANRNSEQPSTNTNQLLSCTRYEFGLNGTQKQTELKFNSETEKAILSIINGISEWDIEITAIDFVFDVEFRFDHATYLYCTAYGYIQSSENDKIAKLDARNQNMLNGFIENATIRLVCVFESLLHSSSVSPQKVSSFEIENGVIYRQNGGTWERFGTVTEITLEKSNFDSFVQNYDGIDRSEQLAELRLINQKAYAVTPEVHTKDIDLYYVLEQRNGGTLLVYGFYSNGKKINDITAVYQIWK